MNYKLNFKYAIAITVAVVWTAAGHAAPAETLVFAGAEGYGVETPAGRGGDTLRVTTLRDFGRGSLRDALNTPGPRVIVFDVAGIISLSKPLIVQEPFFSLLGQTAPSPGITIRDSYITFQTHDILVQHIRFRPGDEAFTRYPGEIDGFRIHGSMDGSFATYNVIIDHCSVSWTIDEAMGIWYKRVHDVTISNCIFAEALNDSRHPDGPHGFGPMIGPNVKRVAFMRNLIAHCTGRTPDIQGNTETVLINNVIYNPLYIFIAIHNPYGAGDPASTIIGNVCLKGPDAAAPLDKAVHIYEVTEDARFYVADNFCDPFPDDPWESVATRDPNSGAPIAAVQRLSEPELMPRHVTILPSSQTLEAVLQNAGARPYDRDATDRRVVKSVRTRGGGIINSQSEVGGWLGDE